MPFRRQSLVDALLMYALIYAGLVAIHASLLRLPYFWDEAGYYVPAARDILLTGSLIPTSTLSNAHPPLLLAYLAGMWKVFGYSPLVTRLSMLLVSTFGLLGVFRLARRVLNTEVAVGSVIALALYPVYFAQSSLAQMDLGAAAFVIWGLDFYFANRRVASIVFFSAAALTKETAILLPCVLFAWELLLRLPRLRALDNRQSTIANSFALLFPVLPLAAWFAYHYSRTGRVFGNPQFYAYNVAGTLSFVRFLAAFALRIWHLFGYMNMALLTAAVLLAMTLPPLAAKPAIESRKSKIRNDVRPRIAIPTQLIFYLLILAHLVAFALVGGAALARYLLPVYPLVIILGVSTLRRRLPWWPAFLAVICAGFVIALITEPPYRFAPEDNLAYSDYVRLHESAERLIATRFPGQTVLTAWPASDELTRPWLGYVSQPVRILRIEDFSFEQLQSAAQVRGQFQLAFVFSTKEEPRLLLNFRWWERLQERYFGYHRDLSPEAAAQVLGGRLVYQQHRGSQWVGVIALDVIENASARPSASRLR
ncbi:MAG: ArnT family glycosyltransferase [Terriglobales bacterium]